MNLKTVKLESPTKLCNVSNRPAPHQLVNQLTTTTLMRLEYYSSYPFIAPKHCKNIFSYLPQKGKRLLRTTSINQFRNPCQITCISLIFFLAYVNTFKWDFLNVESLQTWWKQFGMFTLDLLDERITINTHHFFGLSIPDFHGLQPYSYCAKTPT